MIKKREQEQAMEAALRRAASDLRAAAESGSAPDRGQALELAERLEAFLAGMTRNPEATPDIIVSKHHPKGAKR
ncbi:MAG: hypothetical protein GC199_00110 [Alphaproteobacteria bacterium]|nr:hypothetical protein [Alphaproteobacteria bacterium]